MPKNRFDADTIKRAARNHWIAILITLGGLTRELLDGRGHPCPLCGGTDRFSAFKDCEETGGVMCRRCFSEKCGDGFAALMWLQGWNFSTAINEVATFLNLDDRQVSRSRELSTKRRVPETKSPSEVPDFHNQAEIKHVLDLLPGSRIVPELWANRKGGFTAESCLELDPLIVSWPKRSRNPYQTIGFFGYEYGIDDPVSLVLYRVDGQFFEAVPEYNLPDRKAHLVKGSRKGFVFSGGREAFNAADIVFRVEGIPDLVSLVPLLPDGAVVFTSVTGCSSHPSLEWLKRKTLFVFGDADKPGQDGAIAFAREAAEYATSVRILGLPYEVADTHGKDIRDWVIEGHDRDDLLELMDSSELVEPEFIETTPSIPAADESVDRSTPAPDVTGEHLPVDRGAIVRATDRANYGRVVQDLGGKCLVHFISGGGDESTVELPKSQLVDENGQPLTPQRFSLGLMTSTDFSAADFRQNYLVHRVLVEGQPCIVGGPKKCLKTGILVDLAISLGTGTQFLSHPDFVVPERVMTCLLSGESGGFVLRETAQRICTARNRTLSTADVVWGFDLPQLANPEHLDVIEETIRDRGIRVLMVDPAYLSLLSGTSGINPGDVFAMGAILKPIGELGVRTGCTIVVAHHTRKKDRKERFQPTDLEDLAMSGFAEWARQWLLLGRRSEYQGDGHHDLWLNAGGSAGHSGCYVVSVEEGVADVTGNGRIWDVRVERAAQAIKRGRELAEQRKAEDAESRWLAKLESLAEVVRGLKEPETKSRLRNLTKPRPSADEFELLIHELVQRGVARRASFKRNGRTEHGYEQIPLPKYDGRHRSATVGNADRPPTVAG